MKKLLSTLMGLALVAFSASAVDYYVIGGNVNGKSWSLAQADCKFTAQNDGTYIWTGTVLGSGFKINDGTWGDTYNFGSNGSKISIGTAYNYGVGGSTANIDFDASFTLVNNPQIVLNPTAGTITLTGDAVMVAPDLYLRGEITGWNLSDTYKFKNTSGTTYTLTVPSIEAGSNFKFSQNDWEKAWTANNTNITENGTYGLENISNDANTAFGKNVTNVTFTVELTENPTVQIEGTFSDEVSYPDQLYVVGTIDGNIWKPDYTGAVMTKSGTATYSISNLKLVDNDAAGAMFSFLTTPDANWSVGNRYGSTGKDENVNISSDLTKSYTLYKASSDPGNFVVNPGTYDIKVDLEAMTMTCTLVEGGDTPVDPDPTPGTAELYIRGNMNDWGAVAAWKFTTTDNINYTLSNVNFPANSQFKVADDSWNNANTYSYTEGPLSVDTEYTLVQKDGEDDNMTLEYGINNATVTYNGNTHKFMITGTPSEVTPTPTPGELPATLYLIGDVEGYAWSTSKGVSATGNKGVYTYKGVSVNDNNGGNGYISFVTVLGENWNAVNAGDRYGAEEKDEFYGGDIATKVVLYPANVSASGANSWMMPSAKYDFIVDLNDMTMKATVVGEADQPELPTPTPPAVLPETLYLMGNVNGYGWNTNEGIAAKGNNGVYTYNNVTVTGDGKGYLTFVTVLASASDDWDTVNSGDRFGALSKDAPLTAGTPAGIQLFAADNNAGSANSWAVPVGVYNFTADLNNMQLTATLIGDITPDNPTPAPDNATIIYVVGSGDGLTWDLPGKAYNIGNDGKFVLNIDNLTKFKFSTVEATEWDGDNGFNAHAYATGDKTFTSEGVSAAGGQTLGLVAWGEDQELPYTANYTVTIDLQNMTMNVATTQAKPEGPATVYVRGAMNEWGAVDTWKMTYNEAKDEYTFTCVGETAIEAGMEFKFADANWGNVNYGNGNLSIMASAEGSEEVLVKNGENMAMAENFTGTITLKIDATGAVATFTSGKGGDDSGVDAIEAADANAEYYNLQGVKVANPDKGIYIKVTNGKAVKVVK